MLKAVGEGLSAALAIQYRLMEASLDNGPHFHLQYNMVC